MLIKKEMLMYAKPKSEQIFELDLSAPQNILKEAIALDEDFIELYGFHVFENIADVKKNSRLS